jgi:uncharacterized membrane protein
VLYAVLALANLVMSVYCVLDIIRTPDEQVRHLPKLAWIVLCLFFGLVGGIAWLKVGRPARAASLPSTGTRGPSSPFERPGRSVASNPDDDEAFLRQLRERAEEQRRRARDPRDDDESAPPTT